MKDTHSEAAPFIIGLGVQKHRLITSVCALATLCQFYLGEIFVAPLKKNGVNGIMCNLLAGALLSWRSLCAAATVSLVTRLRALTSTGLATLYYFIVHYSIPSSARTPL